LSQWRFGECWHRDGQPAVYADPDHPGKVICMQHFPKNIVFAPFLGQQTKFFERKERIVFYGGAGGGGKSLLLRWKFAQQLAVERGRMQEANAKGQDYTSRAWGAYFRRTTKNLLQVIERCKEEFPQIDPAAKFNQETKMWIFPSFGGARFQLSHMEHEDNKYDWKSAELTFGAWDELSEFTDSMFDYVDTRMRTDDPILQHMIQVVAASNPDGRYVGWVKKRFIDIAPPETVISVETRLDDGREMSFDQIFIPAKLDDNPKLMASGLYELSLMNKPAHVREAILRGNWNIAVNSFLSDVFRSDFHVCDDHDPPEGAPISRSMDWGIRKPGSCGWWYEDADGGLTMFRHLRFQGLTVLGENGRPGVADLIREMEQAMGLWDFENECSALNDARNPLDSQCFAEHGMSNEKSIAGEFRKAGIKWKRAKKGPGSRYLGAQQIINMLSAVIPAAFEGATHPREAMRPMLRFCRGCKSPCETIPILMPDPSNSEDVDTRGDDHDYDMVMYRVLEVTAAHRKETEYDGFDERLSGDDIYAPRQRQIGAGPWTR
jgi:hypothetical protein